MADFRWIFSSAVLLATLGVSLGARAEPPSPAAGDRSASNNGDARAAAHPRSEHARLTDLLALTLNSAPAPNSVTGMTVSSVNSEVRSLRQAIRSEDRVIAQQDALLRKLRKLEAEERRSPNGRPAAARTGDAKPAVAQSLLTSGSSAQRAAAGLARPNVQTQSKLVQKLEKGVQQLAAKMQTNNTKITTVIAQVTADSVGKPNILAALAKDTAQATILNKQVSQLLTTLPSLGSSPGRSPATASR